MMKNNEINEKNINTNSAEEKMDQILNDYAEFLGDKWEDEDPDFLKSLDEFERKRETKSPKKCEKSLPKIMMKTAAILVVGIIAVSTIPGYQACAWNFFDLDFLFGHEEDHREVESEADFDFIAYEIKDLPDGYNHKSEIIKENTYAKSIYVNDEGKEIRYTQYKKDAFTSKLDDENKRINKEYVSDFKVLVCMDEEAVKFEITTDENVMIVDTNDTYEVGKKFIENLVLR